MFDRIDISSTAQSKAFRLLSVHEMRQALQNREGQLWKSTVEDQTYIRRTQHPEEGWVQILYALHEDGGETVAVIITQMHDHENLEESDDYERA